jgi:hypothetical protein
MELTSLVQKFRLSRSRAEAASPKWVKAGLGGPRWHLQDIVRAIRGRGAALKATEQPIDTGTAAVRPEMLARLVLKGLATGTTGTMRAGAATMKVERYRITDDGRNALAD